MFSRIATAAAILMTSTTAMAGWTTSLPEAEPTADDTYDYGGFGFDLSEDEPQVLQAYDEIVLVGGIVYTIPEAGYLTESDVREWSIALSESVFASLRDATLSDLEAQPPVGEGRRVRTWGFGTTGPSADYQAREEAVWWCRTRVAIDSYPVRVQTASHEKDVWGDHLKSIDWECTQGSDVEARGGAGLYMGSGVTRSEARKHAHDQAAAVCAQNEAYPIWRGIGIEPAPLPHGGWHTGHLFNCSPSRVYVSISSNSGPDDYFMRYNQQHNYNLNVYGN